MMIDSLSPVLSAKGAVRSTRFSLRISAVLYVSALFFLFPFGAGRALLAAQAKSAPPIPSYRIAGQIVDASTNTPLGNAELSFAEADADMKVSSDEQGRFLFAPLDPGKYALFASAPGYVTEAYNQHYGYSTAIAVGPGLDSEHLLFRLHRQAVITGTITDEHGEPVRNAQVLLFAQERGGRQPVHLASIVPANDLGVYRFSKLQAGKYFLAVSAHPWYAQTGFVGSPRFISSVGQSDFGRGAPGADSKLDVVYPVTFFPGATDEHSASPLVVNPGDIQEADVTLQPVPSTHVRLTNMPADLPNGAGVNLAATHKLFDSFDFGAAMSFGQISPGVFEISGLPPGDITLIVNSNHDGETEARTLQANLSDGASLDAGGTSAAATVSGKITPADGSATLQGSVSLTARDGRSATKNLEKDGSFHFSHVEPGTYEVQVSLGGEDYVKELAATGAKVLDQMVKIDGSEEVRLQVRMGRGFGEIKGVVKNGDKPQSGAMVLLVPTSGEKVGRHSRLDQSDSDGTFSLTGILPGNYLLTALDDWDLDWQDPQALDPYRAKAQSITIAPEDKKTATVEQQKVQPAPNSESEN